MSDQVMMKILNDLEGAMDDHDAKMYAERKEKPMAGTPDGNPDVGDEAAKKAEKSMLEKMQSKDKATYLDPARENQLKQIDLQSNANDPIMMRGQFGRSTRRA